MSTGNIGFGELITNMLGNSTFTTSGYTEHSGLCNDMLKRCAYKPGWELWVDGDSYSRWVTDRISYVDVLANRRVLRIKARVIDSNDHDKTVEITHSFEVPESVVEHEDLFIRFVSQCLQNVERHECKEFFMVDGKRHEDPHRNQNTRLYE